MEKLPSSIESNYLIFLGLLFLYCLVTSIFRYIKYRRNGAILFKRVSYFKEFSKKENESRYKFFCIFHILIYMLLTIITIFEVIYVSINVLPYLLIAGIYIIFRSFYHVKFRKSKK